MLNNRGLNLPVTYSRLQKVPGFFSALQRIQEIHEIGHILCAETDVKPDIIEVDQSSQSGCVAAVNARSPLDHVQVQFEDAPLAQVELGHRNQGELDALAQEGAARAEEQVFHELLGNGGSAAAPAFLQ